MLGRLNSFLDNLLAPQGKPGPLDDFWYQAVGGRTKSGVDVNESTALNYSACWAATRLLSGSAAMLPFHLYRWQGKGVKDIALDHPVYRLIHDEPNPEMGSLMFRARGVGHQVNWGNAYAEIQRDQLLRPIALWPIHPSRCKPIRDEQAKLWYEVRNNDNSKVYLDPHDVFHVASWMTEDGILGKGVIAAARETIGAAKARQEFGAGHFGNGALPGIIIKHPKKLSPEARQSFRTEWNEIHAGAANAGKLALLQEGAEAQVLSMSPVDSQFVQSSQFDIEEIARWYGVPPHLIQHLLRATFNNIEELGISFVTYSLVPWLKSWEIEVWRKLLTPAEQKEYFAKHAVDALLRGNAVTRTAALQQQFFNGEISVNEWRELEDRNRLPAEIGDKHFVQSAMIPIDAMVAQYEHPPAAPPDRPAPDPPAPAAGGDLAVKLRTALRPLLLDTFGRLARKEANAIRRAAQKPGEFLAWMDEFIPAHQPVMVEALAPAELAYRSASMPLHADAEAASWCHASKDALLALAGQVRLSELAQGVEELLSSWQSRPADVVNRLTDLPAQADNLALPGPPGSDVVLLKTEGATPPPVPQGSSGGFTFPIARSRSRSRRRRRRETEAAFAATGA